MFSETILSQTENFLLLYVLGLLLQSDASMQQLDIPVIIICKFFTKEYLIKISCVCHFSPYVFCMLFGIIKQICHPCVVYNRNNSPSRGLSPSGYALGRQSSLGGVIPVVQHTGMAYLYSDLPGITSAPFASMTLVPFGTSRCWPISLNEEVVLV